jgi:hypothetical protein
MWLQAKVTDFKTHTTTRNPYNFTLIWQSHAGLRLSGARAAQQLDFGRYYDPATAHGKPEPGAWVYLKKS